MNRDGRIDDCIASAAPFARPILERFRQLVHAAVPHAQETIKWGVPHFTVSGKILAGMAAFKAHVSLIVHGMGERQGASGGGMGHVGKLASIDEFPDPAMLTAAFTARSEEILSGKTPARTRAAPKPELTPPGDLLCALTPPARAAFDGFTPAQRRDYVEWVVEAKRPETRARRIAQAAEWLAEGKTRHWKYKDC